MQPKGLIMLRRVLAASTLMLVTGCASDRALIDKSMSVTPGMTKAEVVSIMGNPKNRSFRDNAEVLQF